MWIQVLTKVHCPIALQSSTVKTLCGQEIKLIASSDESARAFKLLCDIWRTCEAEVVCQKCERISLESAE